MKNKITEGIRQLLIKTVLPLRKRKEKLLSKFHFSITFRISLNYLKLLIINGALFFILFLLFYLGMANYEYKQMGSDIVKDLKSDSGQFKIDDLNKDETYESDEANNIIKLTLKQNTINPYEKDGLSMCIYDTHTKTVIYDDIEYDISKDKILFNRIYFNKNSKENRLIISDKKQYKKADNSYSIYFQYNLTNDWDELMKLLCGMSIIYVFIVYIVIKRGQKGDLKLIEPITDMTVTAKRLTVNNLDSQRINVEGTKNELKDLATVINEMLDRIETSYESQKQFVSDASHELRTPIAVIQGYANLLDRWGKNDKEVMEESIEAIRNESKSMQDLVEKLLFLSRHDKKTLKLTKSKFDMKEIIEDMVKETKLVVTGRLIENPILDDVVVYGDKQALKQAIRVFIDNAVKYTKDGDKISISCENNNGDCVITVSDTGIGMTRKDVDHIFERFYRSDEVRNQKISGHGLGLSIAKLIVLGHTGRIKVRSQFTVGTSFIITLPKRQV